MTTVLRDRLYKINVTITAFIDVVDINDMSARSVAYQELKDKIGDKFEFELQETEVYDIDELPR